MKRLTIVLLLFYCAHLGAQDSFLRIEDAMEEADSEDKPIMLVFSGSDWCKPCIELKKNVLESEAFESFSDNLIMLYLDFPYKKSNKLSKEETKHNEALAALYNRQGQFPKIVFVDSKQKKLGEVFFESGMTSEVFIEKIQKKIL